MPPLDLSRPLELDDGTPVTLIQATNASDNMYVRVPKYDRRTPHSGGTTAYYNKNTGIWCGGDAERFYVIRNAGPAVPEEYEEWFV